MIEKMRNRILVVEDESHIAFGIKFNLEAEGFQVTVAEDGPSALSMIESPDNQFELIILDLMLPIMSGYAVCRQLRDAGNDIPILMLSARSLAEDRTQGFDAGTNQYLTKPFDLDELISRVKNLLSMGKARASKPNPASSRLKQYEFGQTRIDFEAYEARVNGKLIRLTALQLKLLEYFIEHQGRVVTRQELLENVWNMPGYMNTRAPDQFLRQMRKTFELEPSRPKHFLTVRDVGYRFVPEPKASDSISESDAEIDSDID
jgi:two-component system, OmpR family, alkaline phosphatase synthesis response regulator PhoP